MKTRIILYMIIALLAVWISELETARVLKDTKDIENSIAISNAFNLWAHEQILGLLIDKDRERAYRERRILTTMNIEDTEKLTMEIKRLKEALRKLEAKSRCPDCGSAPFDETTVGRQGIVIDRLRSALQKIAQRAHTVAANNGWGCERCRFENQEHEKQATAALEEK